MNLSDHLLEGRGFWLYLKTAPKTVSPSMPFLATALYFKRKSLFGEFGKFHLNVPLGKLLSQNLLPK
jgi:hypothetical protein